MFGNVEQLGMRVKLASCCSNKLPVCTCELRQVAIVINIVLLMLLDHLHA